MMTVRGNGKLLLTGEYLIIDGAAGLSLPTKYGQVLTATPNNTNELHWKSLDAEDQIWFEARISAGLNEILYTTNTDQANYLVKLLKASAELQSGVPKFGGLSVITKLDFPNNWGLGSSSTLIYCVAKWQNIQNGFELFQSVSEGSGYDFYAAGSNQPFHFLGGDSKSATHVEFNPSFKDQLYFVHLNRKQKSDREVARYSKLKETLDLPACCNVMTNLTHKITKASTLAEFESLIDEHEFFMSGILETPTVREEYFSDYSGGSIKSLGAWGGDFILATGNEEIKEYFQNRGYQTVIPYSDMILNA